jgi:hypothetical protein
VSGYKLYFMNRAKRIQRRVDIEAHDDAQAVALADKQSDGQPMELWLGDRLVKSFPGKASS